MSVKQGFVTLLAVCLTPNGISLLTVDGESVAGPTLQIGNTNCRYRLPLSAREFMDSWSKAGPSHSCAVGNGHKVQTIEKSAFLLGVDYKRVCGGTSTNTVSVDKT